MKLVYFSDLHLEFIEPNKIQEFVEKIQMIPASPPSFPRTSTSLGDSDVLQSSKEVIMSEEICIMAGDIGNPYHSNYDIFMDFISKKYKKSFVISGNHEYYNKTKTIKETNDFLENYFRKFDNISFLNNTWENYNDYCFIGTTLWSKIMKTKYEINDTSKIPQFDYKEYNDLHLQSVEFLENTLENNDNCIIITHHVPSYSLIDKKYKNINMSPYNQWFYCDMDPFIEKNKNKIKCWIYGHTHTPSEKIIHNIPFLCNSLGYPGENKDTEFYKTITIH